MARAQGKHREFGINWSVATLSILFRFQRATFSNTSIQKTRWKEGCVLHKYPCHPMHHNVSADTSQKGDRMTLIRRF